MHHTLKLYNANRPPLLRLYMFFGACTRIPLLGRLVRRLANTYSRNMHGAYLLTPTEAEELVDIAEGAAVSGCTCRKVFDNCDHPRDNEILLGPTLHVLRETMPADAREIDKERAREVLREGHQRGLIFTVLRCREDFYAICSCCSCCCVPLRLSKKYGIGGSLVRHKDIVGEFRRYQQTQLSMEHA